MKRTIIYITLQLVLYFCLNAQNEQQSSTRFAVKAPQEIFIGCQTLQRLEDADYS